MLRVGETLVDQGVWAGGCGACYKEILIAKRLVCGDQSFAVKVPGKNDYS